MLKYLKNLFKKKEKCEFCRQDLRRYGDTYYGGIDINDTIGGSKKRTVYLCNLCYTLFKK